MTTNEYIFDQHEQDQELLRLRMIEELFDPTTIGHLERAEIAAGWRCLELGAGAGSIMKWMGGVVGDRGSVIGIDKNANHLRGLSEPPLQIIEGDFLEVPLDEAFDLAHCRYVLIHNRASDAILRKLCNVLKPGGFLVVEEPDFTSAKLLSHNADDAQQRLNNAVCRMFEQMGLDPAYGLGLPKRIADAGLHVVEVDSRLHLAGGGSLMARMMGASKRALADKYVATGEASRADIERCIENTTDDRFWTVYYSTISVVATRSDSA
jgi:precorrin-6B methylase 2